MNYSELVEHLQMWIEDDGDEFELAIPKIIKLGEDLVRRDLDLGLFSVAATATTTLGDPLLVRPVINDVISFSHAYADISGQRYWFEQRSVDFVTDYLSDTANGIPKYYAEYDETKWLLAPRPAAAYTVNGRALVRPTGLSLTNTITWLSTVVPDLLLKACLHESEGFVKDDPRTDMWKKQYTESLPAAKRQIASLLIERYQLTPMEIPAQPTVAR